MTDRIGPTFGDELRAANVADGVSWYPDGTLKFSDGVDPIQRYKVMAVLAAHDPTKQLVENAGSITARQLRLWLLSKGVKAPMVEAAINTLAADQRDAGLIEWEYTSTFLLTNPLVAVIGAAILNLDAAGIQAGFNDAAKL